MPLTDHISAVTLEEILEIGEGAPCSTPAGNRSKIMTKIKQRFPATVEKILLINPPMTTKDNLDLTLARSQSYPCYPPYGLALLSTHLEKRGYCTKVIDLNFDIMQKVNTLSPKEFDYDRAWQENVEETLQKFNPDLIGTTCMYTMIHPSMQAVVDFIRSKNASVPLIAGGAHPALAAEDVLRKSPGIDFISLYESDNSFPDMVDVANHRLPESKLTQIAAIVDDNFISVNDRNVPSSEVITLLPNYGDLPIRNYTDYGKIGVYAWLRGDNISCTTILKSRGCRAHCSFCSVREFNGAGVRHRPAKDVVDEIEMLRDKYGIQHFVWLDDDLLNNKLKTMEVFDTMVRRNLGITWDASNGVIAAALDEDLATAAEASGCMGMSFGIESGNTDILRRIHKPATMDRFYKAAEILDRHPNIYTKGFLIVGFPEDNEHSAETIGQMWDTIDLAKKMHLDWYTVQVCMPLPGTEIAKGIERMGRERADITKEAVNRFTTGFGLASRYKHEAEQRGKNGQGFKEVLHHGADYVPTQDELRDVRFFVEYHVNYADFKDPTERTKANKLGMQERCLIEVVKRKDPENPVPHLYLSLLQDRLGKYDDALDERRITRELVAVSPFYAERFNYLGLDKLLEQADAGAFKKDIFVTH